MPGARTYEQLGATTYKDSSVLHIFTCKKSQTSADTIQELSLFGTDLPFEGGKKYTVTLGGTVATVAEDP